MKFAFILGLRNFVHLQDPKMQANFVNFPTEGKKPFQFYMGLHGFDGLNFHFTRNCVLFMYTGKCYDCFRFHNSYKGQTLSLHCASCKRNSNKNEAVSWWLELKVMTPSSFPLFLFIIGI